MSPAHMSSMEGKHSVMLYVVQQVAQLWNCPVHTFLVCFSCCPLLTVLTPVSHQGSFIMLNEPDLSLEL